MSYSPSEAAVEVVARALYGAMADGCPHVVACGDILTVMYRFELTVDSSTTETAMLEYLDRALALWLPAYQLSVSSHAATDSPDTCPQAAVSDSDSVNVGS